MRRRRKKRTQALQGTHSRSLTSLGQEPLLPGAPASPPASRARRSHAGKVAGAPGRLTATMASKRRRSTSGFRSMVFIALGANLGNARRSLLEAMRRLEEFSDHPLLRSSLWQTSPVDCPPGSPPFVNAVVGLLPRAGESPESLLARLQDMEREFGRKPKKVLNEPRPLDLDLIAFAGKKRNTPALRLPHPLAHLRAFVLEPLAEIAPDLVLPGQRKTAARLLAELPGAV